LVYDKGTSFGLNTPNARIESILMSLPYTCMWKYRVEPEPGSEEEKLINVLKNPIDWI
jgi:coproporphyrinogen III oxidase